jgi:hypothetical protein
MNCQTVQKKITEHLAALGSGIPAKVQTHSENCAECRAFYQAQRHLFGALDAGLQNLANEPTPASLVPRVRAGLQQIAAPRSSWTPGWGLATLAVVALVVVSFGVVRARHTHGDRAPRNNPVAVNRLPQCAVPVSRDQRMTPVISPRVREHGHVAVPAAKTADAMSEVIVLPEEREAFERFVGGRTREQTATVLPIGPAQDDQPIDIALLQIKEVEIKTLDPTAEEAR